MTNVSLPLHDCVSPHVHRAISLFMGHGRRFSVEEVASATGINARTLYSYIAADPQDRRSPSADRILMLCGFFGAEFTSKLLSIVGQAAHDLHPNSKEPAVVIANLVNGAAAFAQRGADQRFCHIDQAALEPVADEMIQILEPFSTRRVGE